MEKLLIIINNYSGLKQGKKYLADVLEIFCKAGYDCSVRVTTGKGDATQYAKSNAANFKKIVCIGGDGTFNECISGVIASGEDVEIGYIPCGSTNDFAVSIGLPKKILDAAQNIVTGKASFFDAGSFNGRHFSYVASFGAFTKSSYSTPQNIKNVLGHIAYILDGIKEIGNLKPEHLKFQINGEDYEDDYIFGAICNSTSLGGILTLDKSVVDMNDGLFEILLIKSPKNIIELNECILAIRTQNYNSKMLVFKSASKLKITKCNTTNWTLDGEYQPPDSTVTVENLHSAIKLIVPRS